MSRALVLILVGSLFVLLGIGFIGFGVRARRRAVCTREWPSTIGRILKSRVLERVVTDTDDHSRTLYEVAVEYEFSIEGQSFTSNRLQPSGSKDYYHKAQAQDEVDRYVVGNAVKVYYDPQNPGSAVLERTMAGTLFPILFGSLFLVITLCCFSPIAYILHLTAWVDNPEEWASMIPTRYVNARENLGALLAAHHVPFSFAYPKSRQLDPKQGKEGASDFVRVEHRVEEGSPVLETFSVGPASFKDDSENPLAGALALLEAQLAVRVPNYKKESSGALITLGPYAGYGFDFTSVADNASKPSRGRIVLLPPSSTGHADGLVIILLANIPEVSSFDDLGKKGELAGLLQSFKIER